MVELGIEIAGIKLKNPVMTASGTFGYGKEYSDYVSLKKLGAIITKSITLKKREGNPPPRLCETPSGMLNSIGLQNEGIENLIAEAIPYFKKLEIPIIANIAGESVNEYVQLAKQLSKQPVIKGLELNISCPNVDKGCMQFGISPEATYALVKAVKKAATIPVIIKLSPNVTDIAEISKKAEKAGADAISLINTFVGMSIDINTWQSRLGKTTGGLSGPAIRPIAVRMVYEAAQAVKIPVIGIGGIMNTSDAIEFFLAGASAIQVGTANFVDPEVTIKIISGIKEYLEAMKFSSIKEIIGKLKP